MNKHLSNIIKGESNDLGENNIHLLTRACFVPWTTAYHNRQALNKIVRAIDHEYLKYTKDNEMFRSAVAWGWSFGRFRQPAGKIAGALPGP